MRKLTYKSIKTLLIVSGVFLLLAPFSAKLVLAGQTAVIATAAADYSSGAISVVSVDKVNGRRAAATKLDVSGSDLKVVAHGGYFYRLERSTKNNITKYNINDPSTLIWQFSTDDEIDDNSNPHDLVFVNDQKAYLLRYGSPKVWIVDPSVSANNEAHFKTKEIDLSAYNDADGKPEAQAGVIVGDRLYIILQRIDFSHGWGNYVYNTSYVAVFNTTTNNEIDTGKGVGGLKGIAIPDIKNPVEISYVPATGKLYVLCVGNWDAASAPIGGIVSIDPATFTAKIVITDNNDSYGAVTGMAILKSSKGYFIGEAAWQDDSLYSFNPSTGGDITDIAEFDQKGLAGMDDGIVIDEKNMLWVCNQTDHRIDIVNTATDSIDESVNTKLNPLNIAFAEGSPDIKGFPSGGGGGGGCFISTLNH